MISKLNKHVGLIHLVITILFAVGYFAGYGKADIASLVRQIASLERQQDKLSNEVSQLRSMLFAHVSK